MSKWPFKYRIWRTLHVAVNRLAWKYYPTKDYQDPRNKAWIWRFNSWVGNHYTHWYVTVYIKQSTNKRKG